MQVKQMIEKCRIRSSCLDWCRKFIGKGLLGSVTTLTLVKQNKSISYDFFKWLLEDGPAKH